MHKLEPILLVPRRRGDPPTCHPDRAHHSKGLCEKCYNRESHRRWYAIPENRARARTKSRIWRTTNPERARNTDYAKHVQRKFGITTEQYNVMFAFQQGKCKICEKVPTTKRRLCVDHDHDSGAIRSLLCHHCNSGIGQFFESENLLLRAITYLKGEL